MPSILNQILGNALLYNQNNSWTGQNTFTNEVIIYQPPADVPALALFSTTPESSPQLALTGDDWYVAISGNGVPFAISPISPSALTVQFCNAVGAVAALLTSSDYQASLCQDGLTGYGELLFSNVDGMTVTLCQSSLAAGIFNGPGITNYVAEVGSSTSAGWFSDGTNILALCDGTNALTLTTGILNTVAGQLVVQQYSQAGDPALLNGDIATWTDTNTGNHYIGSAFGGIVSKIQISP